MKWTACILVAVVLSLPPAYGQEPDTDWPRWRGPNADGVADGGKLPLRWSKTENIRWSVKLPGWATSSPVVYGDRVFVTSHLKEKKSLLTLCFNRATGKSFAPAALMLLAGYKRREALGRQAALIRIREQWTLKDLNL